MPTTLAVVLPGHAVGDVAAGLLDIAQRALRDAGVDEILVPGNGVGDAPLRDPAATAAPTLPTDESVAPVLAFAADAAREGGHDRILLHRLDHALTPAAQVTAVLDALAGGAPVAVPVLPVTDTITAMVDGVLGRTVDRTDVRAVCSPWGFTPDALAAAVAASRAEGHEPDAHGSDGLTVDAALRRAGASGAAGANGAPVAAVPGLPAGASLGDELSRRRQARAHPEAASLLPPLSFAVAGAEPSSECRESAGPPPRAAAVVLAAGSGTRFGAPVNKAYLPLGRETVLAHSLRRFAALPEVGSVILVIREDDRERAQRVVAEAGAPVEIVVGGDTRQASEHAALRHLIQRVGDGTVDVIAIHDSARPLTDEGLCRRVFAAALRYGGAVPGVLRPELAVVTGDGAGLLPDVTGPLVAVQTPQAFAAPVLLDAYAAARITGFEGTDTASVVAAHAGLAARWVPAQATNLKITFAEDLPLAELLLAEQHGA
ncbi:2-C-methyl-D-erythritol 4-phosphate cytidylyltransferase [Tersicoccus sp. MR15.9]|uniref:2-C-methyl-D-erythritol 4-phosphate cytidylyltransferase n=1 Tax=Tersicoccus mangrovi TaxID=3121635 RepID=UPI002FE50834